MLMLWKKSNDEVRNPRTAPRHHAHAWQAWHPAYKVFFRLASNNYICYRSPAQSVATGRLFKH
jgi:hypothetical protein